MSPYIVKEVAIMGYAQCQDMEGPFPAYSQLRAPFLLPVSCRCLHEMGVFEGSDAQCNSGCAGNGFLAADAHSMHAVVAVFCKAGCTDANLH
jgi:hypothetical protein